MKKANHIISGILFYSFGWAIAGISYFLIDNFRYYKKHISRKEIEPEIKDNMNNIFYEKTFTTVYPDQPAKDFNEWANHIYKLCNN